MKKEKKAINILIVFFISYKSDVKTFLKYILNQCRTAVVNMTISSNFTNKWSLIFLYSLFFKQNQGLDKNTINMVQQYPD